MNWTPERVKALRKRLGLRQEQFCLEIGVTIAAVRDWEQGRSQPNGSACIVLELLESGRIEPRQSPELQSA